LLEIVAVDLLPASPAWIASARPQVPARLRIVKGILVFVIFIMFVGIVYGFIS
jgi:hypothetical protein